MALKLVPTADDVIAVEGYEAVLKFGTPRQKEYAEAVRQYGGVRPATRALGFKNHQVIMRAFASCLSKEREHDRRSAIHPKDTPGFIPRQLSTQYDADGEVEKTWVKEAPESPLAHGGVDEGPERDGYDTHYIKGVSTLYDASGAVAAQWVKTDINRQRLDAALRDFVKDLVENARDLAPAVTAPAHADADLMAVYPMGDPHFGMYAWAEETGADFDLVIAERLTFEAIDRLVDAAPPARQALLLNLGDFFHADNSKNQTPESGNVLDVDTRHAKVMQVGLRAMVHCINRLREKHELVYVWNMPGNHDPMSSFALALALDAYFHADDRVKVDLQPGLYKYMRFGENLIGSHHGHGAKMVDLPGIMAADCAQAWGETTYRAWYCGHIHHKMVDKEHPGCVVETFSTLAPADAWHAGKGYRAARNMQVIVHHRTDGVIGRSVFNVPAPKKRREILVA